ncbi:hypothetical protein AMTR_s00065p00137220 [Amborella trichopoda]|uniref:Uncharacterized protein n=1 Tax=Amborella trichopoda TaxID=13333 RepID=U5D804_AMBTC|nr:hypothetical protein AMTR_s00065p00137220 [Amborella trichopoda]
MTTQNFDAPCVTQPPLFATPPCITPFKFPLSKVTSTAPHPHPINILTCHAPSDINNTGQSPPYVTSSPMTTQVTVHLSPSPLSQHNHFNTCLTQLPSAINSSPSLGSTQNFSTSPNVPLSTTPNNQLLLPPPLLSSPSIFSNSAHPLPTQSDHFDDQDVPHHNQDLSALVLIHLTPLPQTPNTPPSAPQPLSTLPPSSFSLQDSHCSTPPSTMPRRQKQKPAFPGWYQDQTTTNVLSLPISLNPKPPLPLPNPTISPSSVHYPGFPPPQVDSKFAPPHLCLLKAHPN